MKKKKRGKKSAKPYLLLTVGVLFLGAVLFALQKPKPVFADELRFPVGKEVSLGEIVVSVRHGSLAEPERVVTSWKEGRINVLFTLKNLFQKESEESVLVEFYKEQGETAPNTEPGKESAPPRITSPSEIQVDLNGTPDFSQCTALDSKDRPVKVTVSGEYDTAKAGEYSLTLTATDEEGLTAEKDLTLVVLASPFDKDGKLIDGTYTTKTGKTLEIRDGIAYADGILIANKSYSLPKSYTSPYLSAETEQAYYQMKNAAQKAGHTLTIKSAYRSWNDQDYIFKGYVRDDGLEAALTFSARPGHSEHQTGLAMDLVTSSSEAARTPAIKTILDWLNENAAEYGFILRYPENKSDITGYIYEPWHFRYVGKDLAKNLYNNGDWITLEEYFGIDSVYRGY